MNYHIFATAFICLSFGLGQRLLEVWLCVSEKAASLLARGPAKKGFGLAFGRSAGSGGKAKTDSRGTPYCKHHMLLLLQKGLAPS